LIVIINRGRALAKLLGVEIPKTATEKKAAQETEQASKIFADSVKIDEGKNGEEKGAN
jgi:hypothetical protein